MQIVTQSKDIPQIHHILIHQSQNLNMKKLLAWKKLQIPPSIFRACVSRSASLMKLSFSAVSSGYMFSEINDELFVLTWFVLMNHLATAR
jgi:hypothetical protein